MHHQQRYPPLPTHPSHQPQQQYAPPPPPHPDHQPQQNQYAPPPPINQPQQQYPPPPQPHPGHQPQQNQYAPPPPLVNQPQKQYAPPPPPHPDHQPQQNQYAPPPPINQPQLQYPPPPAHPGHPPQHRQYSPMSNQNQYSPMANQNQQYPPMSNQNQYSPMANQNRYSPMQRLQQARQKLDGRLMPSVIQMINDEIERYSMDNKHIRFTAPSDLPPLVTTIDCPDLKLIMDDAGCSRPCHIRSTIYQVPLTKETLDQSGLDFGVIVKPFDDGEVDGTMYVPQSQSEIVRCNRCMAYMNPYMRFFDSGKKFQCCLCSLVNDVPSSYHCPVDHNSTRMDKMQRPELHLGSYEFKATKSYYRNELEVTRRPHIIFAFEMTQNSRQVIQHVSKYLPDIIKDYIPTDFAYSASPAPLVGFITYNSKIYMYDVANGGHAYVICDMASAATMASTSQFLLDPTQHFEEIKQFLEALPTLCSDSDLETQTVLGPVIEAAFKTCAADTTNLILNGEQNGKPLPNQQDVIPVGKIYMFHCSLPTYGDANTAGRIVAKKSPDDMRRLLGTEKEKEALTPNAYYTALAQKCITGYASGVELFLFPQSSGPHLDIASIGELARLTGSSTINKYYNETSPENFIEDLKHSLRSTVAFDAQMKVRTSPGISPFLYLGNFSPAIGSNYDMSSVNTTSNIAVQLSYDDKLPEKDLVVVQFAMIYTSVCGERRIRVHNLALSTCQYISELFRTVCCDTYVNLLIKESMQKLKSGEITIKQLKEQLANRVVAILVAYRKHCATPDSGPTQLILPEAMKFLPMYLCGALKCDAIDGGPEMSPDDKALSQIQLLGSTPSQSQVTLYPRLFSIEPCAADQEDSEHDYAAVLSRCYTEILEEQLAHCYVLENGYYLFIYFPNNDLGKHFLDSVFGRNKEDDYLHWVYRDPETSETKFLESLIKKISQVRKRALKVSIVRQSRDKIEAVFKNFLYEDKKVNVIQRNDTFKLDNASYVEVLCSLHQEIRAKLNQ